MAGRGAAVFNNRFAANSGRKQCGMGSSSSKLRKAHNRSVPRGTRFPLMPHEQVLKHGVDAFVFRAVQFRIFVK